MDMNTNQSSVDDPKNKEQSNTTFDGHMKEGEDENETLVQKENNSSSKESTDDLTESTTDEIQEQLSDKLNRHEPQIADEFAKPKNVKSCDSDKEKVENESDDPDSSSEDEYESADEGEIEIEEEQLKLEEEKMTEEEKTLKKEQAQKYKEEGNKVFKDNFYKEAIKYYSRALQNCPYSFLKERSIMYSNRAACKLHMERYDEAIKDCSKAIELHPHYLKAILRRAELYEKVDKLDEALADYQRVVELDPSQHVARQACMRLPDQIKERNEKMKEEMMGKLKDLGNMILKPFGLSTNNFNLQQDPKTGGYSVNFQQNSES